MSRQAVWTKRGSGEDREAPPQCRVQDLEFVPQAGTNGSSDELIDLGIPCGQSLTIYRNESDSSVCVRLRPEGGCAGANVKVFNAGGIEFESHHTGPAGPPVGWPSRLTVGRGNSIRMECLGSGGGKCKYKMKIVACPT